jgi:hypothetical protein
VRVRDNIAEDSLLTVLSEASPSLPDQFSTSKKSAKRKILLTITIKKDEVKADMDTVCKPAFVDVPKSKCSICPENLSSGYSWDHRTRDSANDNRSKHEIFRKKTLLSHNR